MRVACALVLLQASVSDAFVLGAGLRPSLRANSPHAAVPPPPTLPHRTAVHSRAAPQMGLFGLGAPELAVIGAVALFILGPDQVKKLAKDIGKVSAELKQVPEEFNKGMEVGAKELEAKAPAPAPEAKAPAPEPPTTPTTPPSPPAPNA